MSLKIYAIILAAGRGTRFKGDIPKQFVKLSGKTVLEHTVSIFEKHPKIDEIYIVTLPEYVNKIQELILKNEWKKVSQVLIGGKTRQESSFIGINAIPEDEAYVLIHDAVRPFVSQEIIDKVIEKLSKFNSVDVAIPSTDTIVKVNNEGIIIEIPERKYLWRGQTPQGFKLSVIRKAHLLARKESFTKVTDDCGLVEHYKLAKTVVVRGNDENIKITTPIDLHLAEKIFQLKTAIIGNISIEDLKNLLANKVGIVFGGSRGIGKAITDLGEKLQLKILGFSRKSKVDIRNSNQVRQILQEVYNKYGRIDFIIVTAAILRKKALHLSDYEEIKEQIDTNLWGSIVVAKESFPYLVRSKGHLILFTSSSYTRGRAFYSIYSSTKAAIVNLVQALAEEWESYGIKVNAICPERTATPMRLENFGMEPPETLLSPEKVALVTLKVLASEITGQVIEVRKNEEKDI